MILSKSWRPLHLPLPSLPLHPLCRHIHRQHLDFPTTSNPSPYEIFHLTPSASSKDIRTRYLDLVRLYHPDTVPSQSSAADREQAHSRFTAIQNAHNILSHPLKRAHEDRRYHKRSPYTYADPYHIIRTYDPYSNAAYSRMPHERMRQKYPSTLYDYAYPSSSDIDGADFSSQEPLSPRTRRLILCLIFGSLPLYYWWQLNHMVENYKSAAQIHSYSPSSQSSPSEEQQDSSFTLNPAAFVRQKQEQSHKEAADALHEAQSNAFIWTSDHRHRDRLVTPPSERPPNTEHGS